MARIVYVAWILHYKKRLDVFIRPEPRPASRSWGLGTDSAENLPEGGVRWQPEGPFERYARHRVEAFLAENVERTGIAVTLIAGNESVPTKSFSPSDPQINGERLTISYLSSRFFSILFLSPSASHALLLGNATEGIFVASSRDLFIAIFSQHKEHIQRSPSLRQRLRTRPIPPSLPIPLPSTHVLDSDGLYNSIISTGVIWTMLFLDRFESWVFSVVSARPVIGDEPWKQWDRACGVFDGGSVGKVIPVSGSIRRD